MTTRGIDQEWLRARVAEARGDQANPSNDVTRLRQLLVRCAEQFYQRRRDVLSSEIVWPSRGLRADEARSFLRAVDCRIVTVDDAGYVTLPKLRVKAPIGRYALLGKSGNGVSVNLEYLVQIGATAELILDNGWPPESIDFERGEFDALALDGNDRVVLAMEAKARVTGTDSLQKLVTTWLHLAETSEADLATNAGRKFQELLRLTQRGPLLVWLVANDARWPIWAERIGETVTLSPATSVARSAVLPDLQKGPPLLETHPFDSSLHRPGTAAHDGGCSWHGPVTCAQTPVISFRDRSGAWQSGCERAVDELQARGEIRTLGPPERNRR